MSGDPVRLVQVVVNLLHNAAKYTPPNGHVAVQVERSGDDVVVTVADDGRGIHAEVLPRIFDVFVTDHRAPDCVGGGLGLGLALVRTLIELHGGTVTARSGGTDQGTRFELRLPALSPGDAIEDGGLAADAAAAGDGAPEPRRALDVAVVDDNRETRESLRMILELLGCSVAEAGDGPSGLDLIRRHAPDVALVDIGLPGLDGYALAREALDILRAGTHVDAVLMDLMMPEMDGYETIGEIRKLEHGRDLPIIALTAKAMKGDRERCLMAGATDYVTKPVNTEQLLSALRAWI